MIQCSEQHVVFTLVKEKNNKFKVALIQEVSYTFRVIFIKGNPWLVTCIFLMKQALRVLVRNQLDQDFISLSAPPVQTRCADFMKQRCSTVL